MSGEGKRSDANAVQTTAPFLVLRHCDSAIGLFDRVASCFIDHRAPELVVHGLRAMVGQRIAGIALGYEDIDDHDQLRHDPALALLSDRLEAKREDCAALGGKSTLNRSEHAPVGAPGRYHKIGHDGEAIETLFVELYLDTHERAPKRIILDLDATDDPLHGDQEGRFFHGYYKCYCYLPLYIFAGRQLLAAKLRPANIDGAAGAAEEVERIVAQIRERWGEVEILLRADSGFARDDMMTWCEENGVDYLFGLAKNSRLKQRIEDEAAAARAEHGETGKPAIVDAVLLAPGHGLRAAVVGVFPEDDAGARPLPANAADQMLDEGADLEAGRRLARAQEAFYENLNAFDKVARHLNKTPSGKPGAVHAGNHVRKSVVKLDPANRYGSRSPTSDTYHVPHRA